MRKKLIAANWKMFKTPAQAGEFVQAFKPLVADHDRDDIVLCVPFLDIPTVVASVAGSRIMVGAQNMHWEKEGAYTGETSAGMLAAARCTHVIIGHSERRQYFSETDSTVNAKLKAAVAAGLVPIVCVGELLEEREAGLTEEVLQRQCRVAFRDLGADDVKNMVIAYEPVWAIGTGKTATPEMACDAHATIRREAANAFGEGVANKMRMLYGGSVKPENAHSLMSQEEIDGALVGGASLDPQGFAKIVKW
jgi:triosephosphate isomerase